jgi:uncharacterized protein YndB with AHSA1/START domain
MHGDIVGGPIHWRLFIPVAPDRVFAALATASGRERFWAESAQEADNHIEFVFPGGIRHRARILQQSPSSRFVLTYFGGTASFELSPTADHGTDLLLTHEGLDAAEWNEVHAGWLNVLFPLKAWLAFGVDLRNHSAARTWMHGYADQ